MKLVSTLVSASFAVFGIASIAVGIALSFYFKTTVKRHVNEEAVLKNGSEAYKNWVSAPAPVNMQFYIFDVKNAYEIVNNGDKPIVIQKGPYTYKLKTYNDNVTFHDTGTVSYNNRKIYIFDRNMSSAAENDTVTVPNIILVYAVSAVHDFVNTLSSSQKSAVEPLVKGFFRVISLVDEPLFKTLNISDLLWGYKEPLLEGYSLLRHEVHKILGIDMPYIDDKFGLFTKPANGSDGSRYTIYTGETDMSLIYTIQNWNNKTHLDYWNTTYCNMINGTAGDAFHPFISQQETLRLFSTDICRSLYAEFEKTVSVDQIQLYRFIAPKRMLANYTENPDNIGFCVPKCLGSGVLNIAKCKQGAPIVASLPHFYQADQKYVNAIYGMNPNKEEHETYLDIEPITGVGMHVAKRLQLNILINRMEEFSDTKYFDDTIFPILWINESGQLTSAQAFKFKHQVYGPIQLTLIVQYSLIGVGAFICFCVIIFIIIDCQRKKQTTVDVSEPENDRKGLLDPTDT